MSDLSGQIFNIQRFSTEDGPGIRTTVFTKGCPLRCLWCANPESQLPESQIAHRDSLCIGCGTCLQACPREAVSLARCGNIHAIRIDRGKCTGCGACASACPSGAMHTFGRTVTVDEVFDEINRDIGYYRNSGGGVTVSGGEPMMQADFTAAIFGRCREAGIHTALDTCGFFTPDLFEKVRGLTDLVLFDLKLMDREKHRAATGVYNDIILQNARLIAEERIPMIIRIPLIPGINDSEDNLNDTARFVSKLNNKLHIDLLPYHNFGENKYKMLGADYQLTSIRRPDKEQMQRCQEIFKRYSLDCSIH